MSIPHIPTAETSPILESFPQWDPRFDTTRSRVSQVISSQKYPIKKVIYVDPNSGAMYYSVVFLDTVDDSVNICASSQIGCVEKCAFCATGDKRFLRNLTPDEIESEIRAGVEAFPGKKTCYIIMEWMGEPAVNIDNVLAGLEWAYPKIADEFERIVFRVSTIWDLEFPQKFAQFVREKWPTMPKVEFQFQLSLHNAINDERKVMIPSLSKKMSVEQILEAFYWLADELNTKLKCNYLLLNYPDGGTNYSDEHLARLAEVLIPGKTRIKLTRYSDTGKWFSSPDDLTYERVSAFLTKHGIQNKIRELYGDDISAACGMLDYT